MNKDNLVPVIIIIVSIFAVGGILYMARPKESGAGVPQQINSAQMDQEEEQEVEKPEPKTEQQVTKETTIPANTDTSSSIKKFVVKGSNFAFDVKEIKVKKGDKVEILFQNMEGFHDFVLDEFNVKTKQYKDAGEETVAFTADKTGTFEYYCSVGSHRAMGMVGKFIVE